MSTADSSRDLLGGGLIPAHRLGERDMLLAYLDRQRELVFWKLKGLSDEAARAVSTASGLTIHGLVRHLESVERWWVRDRFAGQVGLHYAWTDEDPDGELHVPADVTLVSLLADYRAEIAHCDAVLAHADFDQAAVHRDHSLRWILLHLVEEIARHLGHLDLLAELADGRVGEEPAEPAKPAEPAEPAEPGDEP